MLIQFTPVQMKLIKRLRREDRQWPRLRWFVLAMGIVATFLCIAWSWFVYLLIHSEELVPAADRPSLHAMEVFIMFLLCAKSCIWVCFASWCFGKVGMQWHGDVNRMLLLKLLDAQQEQQDLNDNAA